jgi:hypothetical protein
MLDYIFVGVNNQWFACKDAGLVTWLAWEFLMDLK